MNGFGHKSDTATRKTPEQEHAAQAVMFRPACACMGETIKNNGEVSASLQADRLLTEVDRLLSARAPDGSYDAEIEEATRVNLMTLVQEVAMPNAVTTTFHPVAETVLADRSRHRTFTWAGRSALQVAESGYAYHRSAAAHERVAVEVAEARRAEAALQDKVQVFISPRMTAKDAPRAVAESEHLADDDAIRISIPVKDESGMVIGRAMQTLLVRDIPIEAWADMLRDPTNLFGKSLAVEEKASALAVMRLFEHFDVDKSALPEGPVSLIAAVLPYIRNKPARRAVTSQLERFRTNQVLLKEKAEAQAEHLLHFEKAVADSIALGRTTSEVTHFINLLSNRWTDEQLVVINSGEHEDYTMTRQLAALLIGAKRNNLTKRAGLAIGNDRLIKQISTEKQAEFQRLQSAYDQAIAAGEQQRADSIDAVLTLWTVDANLKGGGGCSGDNDMAFRSGGLTGAGERSDNDGPALSERKNWKTKVQKCNVPSCPTRPGVVKCGPCGVCMDRCQEMYDKGDDPMKYVKPPTPKPAPKLELITKMLFERPLVKEKALSLL